MNLEDAQRKVDAFVNTIDPPCKVAFEYTKEFSQCFAFFYNSLKYLETKNMNDMLIGHGPLIVSKETGELFKTGSAYHTYQYVKSFNETGDPYGNIPPLKELYSDTELKLIEPISHFNKLKILRYLRTYVKGSLSEIKRIIDRVQDGEIVTLSIDDLNCNDMLKADEIVLALKELGLKAETVWLGGINL